METILSADEIKLYTDLTISDAKLNSLAVVMTKVLAQTLEVKQFSYAQILLEEVKSIDPSYFHLRSFPIDLETIQLFSIFDHQNQLTGYTFRGDYYDYQKVFVLDSEGRDASLRDCKFYATYYAGFTLEGSIVVENNELDNATLTISYLGAVTNYTFVDSAPGETEIEIGDNVNETAANIATKLGMISSANSVVLSLGHTGALTQISGESLTITNPTIPDDLKMAVAYLVAGATSDKSQIEGISGYKLGTKSVTYRSMAEMNFVNDVVEKYLPQYKTINVY